MTTFVTVSNWSDHEVIYEIEKEDVQDILLWARHDFETGIVECNWYTLYMIGENASYPVAVFDDGDWYQPNGYTPLNW